MLDEREMPDEREPLVEGGDGNNDTSRRRRSGWGGGLAVKCNFATITVTLVLLCALSAYFNNRLRGLASQLDAEVRRTKDLELLVHDQQEVVDRFSDSVSNSDVLKRVKSLETQLNATERTMGDRLDATEEKVGNLLNATLDELNMIVR